ncbi:putative signal transduction protein with CBS domain containing protein [Desulfovibrio sp. X2]|uniref:DUF190 domain-containing protein n=1 Tax=Desulfovibrio sp. X2 TaxID=941449 RepID=UPI000358DFBC|nr:DUF190 domain-containing protein [Desulfovibrio sp. X2]EPR43948.1 putative signal transduction protein with CBS domain containing protein [Desulfovibrio sp. X2]
MIDIEILRIFLGETARHEGRPAYEAVVEEARSRGLAGATVLRGVAGFGADSRIHTDSILRLSEDLPVVVEIVDVPERIQAFLPRLEALLPEGLVSLSKGKGAFHLPLRVRDVMSAKPVTVSPAAPVADVVRLLLERGVKAVPVVDKGRPVGMVTGGDLLNRSSMGLRLDIHDRLPKDMQDELLRGLSATGLAARDVMTSPPVSVNLCATVPEAAQMMADRRLKRLVVVDDAGDLAGVISRSDVLRTYSRAATLPTALPCLPPALARAAADAMFRDVPACRPDTPLRQVLEMILQNPLRRVVVTDEDQTILGIVLDGDLIARYAREKHPGLLHSLARLLSGGGAPGSEWRGTAADVMHEDVITVQETTPLPEVLRIMLHNHVRRLVVSDDAGRLKGIADRDTILRLLGGRECPLG